MNKILILTLTLLATAQFTLAQSVSAKINSLNCSAYAANGATTINNVMTTANGSFVTISNVPVFGLPFIQQAKIIEGSKNGKFLDIKLHTVLTNQDLTLRLENQSTKGLLFGANGRALVLTCQASVSRY